MCKNKSEEDKYKSLKIAESCESMRQYYFLVQYLFCFIRIPRQWSVA